jgi:hypothetical protein
MRRALPHFDVPKCHIAGSRGLTFRKALATTATGQLVGIGACTFKTGKEAGFLGKLQPLHRNPRRRQKLRHIAMQAERATAREVARKRRENIGISRTPRFMSQKIGGSKGCEWTPADLRPPITVIGENGHNCFRSLHRAKRFGHRKCAMFGAPGGEALGNRLVALAVTGTGATTHTK